MISGKVCYLESNGYERVVGITAAGKTGKLNLKAHMLVPQEYLEPDEHSELLKVSEVYDFEPKISIVNSYSFHGNIETLEFEQPLENSPAIVAKGRVVSVADSDELIVSVPGLGEELLIEFEEDVSVQAGMFVVVRGQLELELIE